MEYRFDVFISYGAADHAVVEAIVRRLMAEGLRPFFDRWDAPPEGLEQARGTETAVAVFFGAEKLDARREQLVVERLRSGGQVIAVLLPEGRAGEVEALGDALLRVEFGGDDWFTRLVRWIRDVTEPSAIEPPLHALGLMGRRFMPSPGHDEQPHSTKDFFNRLVGSLLESAPKVARPTGGGRADSARTDHVTLGFAAYYSPQTILPPTASLRPGQAVFFFCEIGDALAGALASEPLDPLTVDTVLDVVLFTAGGGFDLMEGASSGRLRRHASGWRVERQATMHAVGDLGDRRLMFPLRSPAAVGHGSFRCNVYHRGVLVQSHYVQAEVAVASGAGALSIRVDYNLSRHLAKPQLDGLGRCTLSILQNQSADGTHSLRFFGKDGFEGDAHFDGHEIQDFIGMARRAYRKVSWGDEHEWTKAKHYRFQDDIRTYDGLLSDLVVLAEAGYGIYDRIVDRLTGGAAQSQALRRIMRAPGPLQLALRQSARHVLPLALIYDKPLDCGRPRREYRLCKQFVEAHASGAPVHEFPCLCGDCCDDDLTTICPGGFWGFRHMIGISPSLTAEQDLSGALGAGTNRITVAISQDPALVQRDVHLRWLEQHPKLTPKVGRTRETVLALLREPGAAVVYFYSHGGTRDGVPFLEVGPPRSAPIQASHLRSCQICWSRPQPIVFLNGCHTTNLEPERAIELVTAFMQVAGAVGVIGTEITIFESLATAFAQRFLLEFLVARRPIGEAVRLARLRILARELNPLGLLYIPFALPALVA